MTIKLLTKQTRVVCRVFLLSLGTLILLAGCSDKSGGGTSDKDSTAKLSSAGIDPCALLTNSEVGQALKSPVGEPERPKEANLPPSLATCRYIAQRGQGVAVMTVMVRTGHSENESRLGFQSAREQFDDVQEVPGIGSDAFWIGNQLNILDGKVYLIVSGDFDLDTAKSLAQRALERIR